MYKDLEIELTVLADDAKEEFSIETPETDITPSLNDRLFQWLDTVDQ